MTVRFIVAESTTSYNVDPGSEASVFGAPGLPDGEVLVYALDCSVLGSSRFVDLGTLRMVVPLIGDADFEYGANLASSDVSEVDSVGNTRCAT